MAKKQSTVVFDLTDADPVDGYPELQDKVPIPKRFREANSIYPFHLMRPGQSFFKPNPDYLRACRTLCQAVATFKKRTNSDWTFVVRSRNLKQPNHINPQKEIGARCWRTE
jgi:hypothetical protein